MDVVTGTAAPAVSSGTGIDGPLRHVCRCGL